MGDAVYCRHGRDVACYGCWECSEAEAKADVRAAEKALAEPGEHVTLDQLKTKLQN